MNSSKNEGTVINFDTKYKKHKPFVTVLTNISKKIKH